MEKPFDLAIIGAGIYGAALAYEATALGLSVLVVDQQDIGAGTSANSLKVIHGGLRYLQSADVRRARYSAAERRELMRYAPHLVKPLHCQVPLGRSLVKNELSVGLVAMFYNWLTRRRNDDMLDEQQVPDAGLVSASRFQANLVTPLRNPGSFALDWHDAQAVDTERLLTQFLRDAHLRQAEILNYRRLTELQRQGDRWQLLLEDTDSGVEARYEANEVVDCTGAWSVSERLLAKKGSSSRSHVKAINLVVRKTLADNAFGFEAKRGDYNRMLFAAPCRGHTMLGTWYFDECEPDRPSVSRETAEQCLADVNSAFSQAVVSLADVSQVHVGYLPANKPSTSSQSDPEAWLQRHNDTVHWEDAPGLWVFKGTKYTTARHSAEEFLYRHPSLCGAGDMGRVSPLPESVLGMAGPASRYGRYNADWQHFAHQVGSVARQTLRGTENHWAGEVLYATDREWARHLDDILVRRLGLGNLGRPAKETVQHALELMNQSGRWDDTRCAEEESRLWASYSDWLA